MRLSGQHTSKINIMPGIITMASSRKEALAKGDVYFYTGEACHRGHIAPRYVSSPICVDCAKIAYEKRKPKTLAELKAKYQADPEYYRKKERERGQADPKKYWAKTAVAHARARARKDGVPFNLSRAYVMSIITDRCPVFDTPFIFFGSVKINLRSVTLDRLDPAKGYVEGNVIVMSMKANTIKSSADSTAVFKVAQWMKEQGL